MSFGGLPFWVYDLEYEEYIARLTGAIGEEYHPRFSRAIPNYLLYIYETSED